MANLASINEMDKYTMTLIHKALGKALKKEENQIDPDVGMVRVNAEIRLDVTGEVGRRESYEKTTHPVKWREEYVNAEMRIGAIFRVLEGFLHPSEIEEVRLFSKDLGYQLDTENGSLRVEKKIKKLKEAHKVVKEVKGPIKTEDDLVSLIVPGCDEPTSWDFMETLAEDLRV